MTSVEDIKAAVSLGVDAIGIILTEQSKRYISIEKAEKILQNLPPMVTVVGVFVNPQEVFVYQAIKALPLNVLQFHGNESTRFCGQFNLPYFKAIAARSRAYLQQAMTDYQSASAFIVDTPGDNGFGGTGETFDWSLIPSAINQPVILAGGLSATNVQQAIHAYSPYAVDVCSGIEQRPGVKDIEKMKAFVKQVVDMV